MTPAQTALDQRFQSFLDQLTRRQEALFAEAAAGVAAVLAQRPGEVRVILNAMGGVEHQNQELQQLLRRTWYEQINGKFQELDDGTSWDRAIARKEDADLDLEHRWRTFRARTVADVWRAQWPRVEATLARPRPCTRCGAELRPAKGSRAETIPCPSCGSANQLLLDAAAAEWFALAPTAYAEEATASMRHEIERARAGAERDRRRTAEARLADLRQWLERETALWRRYAEVMAEARGVPMDEGFVQGRLATIHAELARDQIWVAAAKRGLVAMNPVAGQVP